MESKIIQEIDSYDSLYHFKIGFLFSFILIFLFLLLKNISNNDSMPFIATFNYVEGINKNSEVQLAGINIGNVNKIMIYWVYISEEIPLKRGIIKLTFL